jgi:IS1 family transposase
MNRLSTERRAAIIGCIVEGMGVRATCRITGAAKGTVTRLVRELGEACAAYQDAAFRNLDIKQVQCDEIWAFCSAKDKNVPEDQTDNPDYGSVWTWTAIDAETKLIPSWWVGDRETSDCYQFMRDLKSRIKIGNRIQLTTDGYGCYPPVVDALWRNSIDYAQIIKDYGKADTEHRYSPAVCNSIQKKKIIGEPDEDLVSTSYVERQNLTMRMSNRRFTRLTNAHSKKVENHAAAVSLYFGFYNLCRVHETLTKKAGRKTTPAMAAGVEMHPWSISQLCELLEADSK